MAKTVSFDFGENWVDYSNNALSEDRIKQAKGDFLQLLGNIELKDKTFLDIGFGQGLSLLTATSLGAKTTGCDINPKCDVALKQNQSRFNNLEGKKIDIVVGSILLATTIGQIKKIQPTFDIVHSWGVLHHTGKMYPAIETACNLVKKDGHLIIAIYNKHWTSPIWTGIKWFYNVVPAFIQKIMVKFFAFLKTLAGYNKPNTRGRGMDFYYDVVDWVGGYPYEYASKEEMENFMKKQGFSLVKFVPTNGYTGCNEFVFRKEN